MSKAEEPRYVPTGDFLDLKSRVTELESSVRILSRQVSEMKDLQGIIAARILRMEEKIDTLERGGGKEK